MLIGIDKDEVRQYASVLDKSENKTIFLIGNITNAQKMSLIGNVISADGKVNAKELQARISDIAKIGLRGIKNFARGKDKTPTDVTVIDDAILEELPMMVLYEVAAKILEYNFMSDDERKN